MLKITLKLVINKLSRCLKMVNKLGSKIMKEKIKSPFTVYADLFMI